ncbi:MAG: Bax inhibitor-1/YccA family protein [Burkholderiales bacterium]|nr:MAG: Bax inhibitor-1/YccA family protein [Burkholderiales bacterium]
MAYDDGNQALARPAVLTGARERNRVLRNTYWLLALSLVPTVIGATVGVRIGFNFLGANPFIGLIAFLAIAFGFFFAIERFKNSGIGVALLLGFTFFMGLMLSRLVGVVLGMANGGALIMTAFGGTAVIFAVMASVATASRRDFSGLGNWLFAGVVLLIIAAALNIWLQMPALMLTVSVLAIAIFSAYLLYDVQRIVNGGETNYITATLALYLDVYNIFANLLMLLGIFGGDND